MIATQMEQVENTTASQTEKRVGLTLPVELYKYVEEKRQRMGETLSTVIRQLIRDDMEKASAN